MRNSLCLGIAMLLGLATASTEVAAPPTLSLNDWGQLSVGLVYGAASKVVSLTDNTACFDYTWQVGEKVINLASYHRQRDWIDNFIMIPYKLISLAITSTQALTFCILTDPDIVAWIPLLQSTNPQVLAPQWYDWLDTILVAVAAVDLATQYYDLFVNAAVFRWFFFGLESVSTTFDVVQQTYKMLTI